MILVEDDIGTLDQEVQAAKAAVLAVLQPTEPVWTYQQRADLAAFLDALQAGLRDYGLPSGLTRVVLFYSDPSAISVVQTRLAAGARFVALGCPDAWGLLAKDLAGLRAWADRHGPRRKG